MSKLLEVPQTEWRVFFDRTSKALLGKLAEIEVASLDLGDQIIAEWVPMLGITYEPKDDLLDIAPTDPPHLIRHPKGGSWRSSTGLASIADRRAGTAAGRRFRPALLREYACMKPERPLR